MGSSPSNPKPKPTPINTDIVLSFQPHILTLTNECWGRIDDPGTAKCLYQYHAESRNVINDVSTNTVLFKSLTSDYMNDISKVYITPSENSRIFLNNS